MLACVAHHLVAEHHIELPAAAAGYAGEPGKEISDGERAFAEMLPPTRAFGEGDAG